MSLVCKAKVVVHQAHEFEFSSSSAPDIDHSVELVKREASNWLRYSRKVSDEYRDWTLECVETPEDGPPHVFYRSGEL